MTICLPHLAILRLSVCVLGLLAGCASLLPDSNKDVDTPWKTYEEARAQFDSIRPGATTLAELKAMGLDPAVTPNIATLSHVELLRYINATVAFEGSALDPALKQCVAARQGCYGLHMQKEKLDRERVGNFWVDFLNFRHKTNITGWRVDVLILVANGVVAYKAWSGTPHVHETEEEHHPLGPLQGLGSSVR